MISILTAVKTGAKFLPEAVASAHAQVFTDWELLIGVNGHPPDGDVMRMAQRLAGSKVAAYHLSDCTNKPQAINELATMSHGEWIAVLDADDLWLPDKLAAQAAVMDEHDVIGTLAEYFGNVSGPIPIASGAITFEMLLACNHIVNSSVMLRRELAIWPDTDGLDDYPLWLSLSCEGRRFWNVGTMLTRIRYHPDQWFAGERDNSIQIREQWKCR